METCARRKRKNKQKNKKTQNINNDQKKVIVNGSASEEISEKESDITPVKCVLKETLNSSLSTVSKILPEDVAQPVAKTNDPFFSSLQKKMEIAFANGGEDLTNTLLGNLQKLMNQAPVSDVESSDEEDEYVEYVYKPRQYFAASICNLCKSDLRCSKPIQCSKCKMTFYCSADHMKLDDSHKPLCYALRQVADNYVPCLCLCYNCMYNVEMRSLG